MALADNKPRIVSYLRGTEFSLELAQACVAGDLLMYETDGWYLADADVATCVVVALEEGAVGDTIDATSFAVIRSYTGATAGTQVHTAASGAVAETGTVHVGYWVNATTAVICPLLTTSS